MKPVRFKGSNIVKSPQMPAPVVVGDWTPAQMDLVKRTIAKDATTDELSLFLAMANRMQLDVFAKQIYFTKYKDKVTIMVAIDGQRLIAQRTGRWNGTRRGVKRDENGKITHGWAEVWVKGVEHSVYEETPFYEYAQTYGNWKDKPETMIKKVSEAQALRIAFPQELGEAYIPEEFGHEEEIIKEKTVSDSIEDRFKEEMCRKSEESLEKPESGSESRSESSVSDVDTVESTSTTLSEESASQVVEDGFSDIVKPQD